jgi:hypothetical protein
VLSESYKWPSAKELVSSQIDYNEACDYANDCFRTFVGDGKPGANAITHADARGRSHIRGEQSGQVFSIDPVVIVHYGQDPSLELSDWGGGNPCLPAKSHS